MARGAEGVVDARFPSYFIFGEHPDGRVDLSDGNRETIVGPISQEDARELIADREEMRTALMRILNKYSAADYLLYGENN